MKLRELLRLTDNERRLLARPGFIGFGVFLVTLICVITGVTDRLDVALVTNLRFTHQWTDPFLKAIERPGDRHYVYPTAIFVSIAMTVRRKDLLPMVVTVASLVFTNATTGVFKILTARGFPRSSGPEAFNYANVHVSGTGVASLEKYIAVLGAFPSGHTANVAAGGTLMVLAAYSARPRFRPYANHITAFTVFLCLFTITCSWLRDTHWMTDLIGGVGLGVASTIAATLWALHLPDEWRHPELAGKLRLRLFGAGVLLFAGVFIFAGSSTLSNSGTSIVLVVGTLVVVARQSHKSYQRSSAMGNSPEQVEITSASEWCN
jgi:membrane-associated phospholipid phosphatase